MSGLHADTGAMSSNGTSTIQCAEAYANELRSLKGNMENLMTIWTGPAATKFNEAYTAQAENFDAFQQLLNELGEKIVEASNTLNNTEEDNASGVNGLF